MKITGVLTVRGTSLATQAPSPRASGWLRPERREFQGIRLGGHELCMERSPNPELTYGRFLKWGFVSILLSHGLMI